MSKEKTKDIIFENKSEDISSSFTFDQRVVNVFDDMVSRSIPGYSTIQLLVADLALKFSKTGPVIDVGCSTAETICAIHNRAKQLNLHTPVCFGIDSSPEMISRAKEKTAHLKRVNLQIADIEEKEIFKGINPSVIILSLTLQFIRPLQRVEILKNLYEILNPGGVIIIIEKTIEESSKFNSIFIDYYHNFKKEMGYSDMEIANKREALENVLIPFQRTENIKLLSDSGFQNVTTFFQWFNFSGFLAIK
jgi:tRNA (cmo5U34)-methyltransferase